MNADANNTNTLILQRFLKTSRERVYAAWTSAEELARWFGPATCRVTSAQMDARTGGTYQLAISSEVMGEVQILGEYTEAKAPERLVFTWRWKGRPDLEFGQSTVSVDFIEVEGGTDLLIRHAGLPNAEVRDHHHDGWSGTLEKLVVHLGLGECGQAAFGGFCWNELLAQDVAGASDFYGQLLGWESTPFSVPTSNYNIFKKQGRSLAGLMANPVPGTPPHWLAYVHVMDVDGITSKAASLGGKVCVSPMDVPTVGRLAVLQDPQGAVFGIFKPVF